MQPRRPLWALTALAALAILAALTAHPGPARAQEAPAIERLTIAVWPEFDQRAALVFYIGELAGDTQLPATVSFELPPGAAVHAVAYRNETGGLSNLPFDIAGDLLTLTTPNGSFHVEFYDTALAFDGDARRYTLAWQAAEPVSALTWEVQQPAAASDLALSPGGATLHRDDYGLPLYRIDAGAVPPGTPAELTLEYTKPTPALTLSLLEQTAAPEGEAAPSAADPRPAFSVSNSVFYGLALVIVAALAAVAGYFYSQSRAGSVVPAAGADPRMFTPLPHPPARPAAPPPPAPASPPAADPEALAADDGLTEREIEVLTLVAQDFMNDEIGEKLGISHRTVGRHRENIMSKLDLHSRAELVKYALRIGLIDLED